MVVLAEAFHYLRTYGGRRAVRAFFATYISGQERMYLLWSDYDAVAALPMVDERLAFRFATLSDVAVLREKFPGVRPPTWYTWLGEGYFLYVATVGDEVAAYRCDSIVVNPWVRPILRLRPDQVYMVNIATARAFRRQGITRPIRIAMARELIRLGYRSSWGLQLPLNRAALAAFDRTPDVIERFGTLIRKSVLGHVRFSLTLSRRLSADHVGPFVQLVADLVPGASRTALLFNPGTTIAAPNAAEAVTRAAAKLGIELRIITVTDTQDQVRAFSEKFVEMSGQRVDAVIVLDDPMYRDHRDAIVTLARRHRLPAVYEGRELATGGGLMAYARPSPQPTPLPPELDAHRIRLDPLGGERSGLAINLGTARALGLAIPRSLLLRADQVIE